MYFLFSSKDYDEGEMGQGEKRSKATFSDDGEATTGSYSSLEDDEAETDQLSTLAVAKYREIDNVDLGHGNKICSISCHSCDATIDSVSFLFSDDANLLDDNLSKTGNVNATTNIKIQGNPPMFGTSSDSESPTDPVSQPTVQMVATLRSKVVPTK